jgi:hypothetical protein
MDSATPDTRDGMALAEGAEPAAAEQAPAPKSLKQRLADIRADSFGIGKDTIKMKSKAGVEFTIRGHTIEAVLSEMRPLLVEHEIDLWPYLVDRSYTGNRCDVTIDWTFERLDESDEKRVIRWAGAGTDDGDKGFSKAGTNCLKEMLKKAFLITDRDDAKEEEDKVEHKTDGEVGRAALDKAKDERARAIQQWAKTFKSALETAKTEKDVDRLKTENREQLDAEDLPDVTRQFFNELIADRKAELKDGFPGDAK